MQECTIVEGSVSSSAARPASGRLRRFPWAFALLLAIQTAACWEWRPSTVPPARLIQEQAPGRIRVTTGDGARLVVNHPALVGDSRCGLLRARGSLLDDLGRGGGPAGRARWPVVRHIAVASAAGVGGAMSITRMECVGMVRREQNVRSVLAMIEAEIR